MGVPFFFDKGLQLLLWADSRAARLKITIIGTSNNQQFYVIFVVYT